MCIKHIIIKFEKTKWVLHVKKGVIRFFKQKTIIMLDNIHFCNKFWVKNKKNFTKNITDFSQKLKKISPNKILLNFGWKLLKFGGGNLLIWWNIYYFWWKIYFTFLVKIVLFFVKISNLSHSVCAKWFIFGF